jgi:hypothetical protein
VKEQFEREAATPLPGTPETLSGLIRAETARWSRLIKASNIQLQ